MKTQVSAGLRFASGLTGLIRIGGQSEQKSPDRPGFWGGAGRPGAGGLLWHGGREDPCRRCCPSGWPARRCHNATSLSPRPVAVPPKRVRKPSQGWDLRRRPSTATLPAVGRTGRGPPTRSLGDSPRPKSRDGQEKPSLIATAPINCRMTSVDRGAGLPAPGFRTDRISHAAGVPASITAWPSPRRMAIR